jgi:hypothetical protein
MRLNGDRRVRWLRTHSWDLLQSVPTYDLAFDIKQVKGTL